MTFKLKKLKDWNEYNVNICAHSKCNNESSIIIATRKLIEIDIGLCESHWRKYCEMEEKISR